MPRACSLAAGLVELAPSHAAVPCRCPLLLSEWRRQASRLSLDPWEGDQTAHKGSTVSGGCEPCFFVTPSFLLDAILGPFGCALLTPTRHQVLTLPVLESGPPRLKVEGSVMQRPARRPLHAARLPGHGTGPCRILLPPPISSGLGAVNCDGGFPATARSPSPARDGTRSLAPKRRQTAARLRYIGPGARVWAAPSFPIVDALQGICISRSADKPMPRDTSAARGQSCHRRPLGVPRVPWRWQSLLLISSLSSYHGVPRRVAPPPSPCGSLEYQGRGPKEARGGCEETRHEQSTNNVVSYLVWTLGAGGHTSRPQRKAELVPKRPAPCEPGSRSYACCDESMAAEAAESARRRARLRQRTELSWDAVDGMLGWAFCLMLRALGAAAANNTTTRRKGAVRGHRLCVYCESCEGASLSRCLCLYLCAAWPHTSTRADLHILMHKQACSRRHTRRGKHHPICRPIGPCLSRSSL